MRKRKKQATYLLRVHCEDCGYLCRVTAKHLDAAGSAPLCPCNGQPMVCPEWEDRVAEAQAASVPTLRVLRDKVVQTRSIHRCARCREPMQRGEWARSRAYTTSESDFVSEYICFACDAGEGVNTRALARA